MATTGSNFILVTGSNPVLAGEAVVTPPYVAAMDPVSALDCVNATPSNTAIAAANGVPLDRVIFDLALTSVPPKVGQVFVVLGSFVGGFPKNGCIYITFTGTTAVTLDLTNAANSIGVTSPQAGDALSAFLNALIIQNVSTVTSTITVAPGGSNPANFPNVLAGTTPTVALKKGAIWCQSDLTGGVVSGTAKTILFTPTAAGAIAVAWGGS